MKTLYHTLITVLFSLGSLQAQWTDNGTNIVTSDNVDALGSVGNFIRLDGGNQWINFVDGTNANITLGHAKTANNLELNYGGLDILSGGLFVNGKVGIGATTNLTRKLTVNGGIDIFGEGSSDVGLLLYRPVENGSSSARWFFRADYSDNSSYPYLTNRTPNGKVVIKTGSSSGGSENTHFTIEGGNGTVNAYFENAKLGIGTTTPDAKLAVNGDVHAKEVKVDLNGWPDFVFNKDYTLPSLEDVATHIKENGHLKDIPSEAEVKANGINLGEMDAKLLQKIEELMLYTIQQQKTINEQSEKIELLLKMIKNENK